MAAVLDRAVQLAPDNFVPKALRAAVEIDWRGDTRPSMPWSSLRWETPAPSSRLLITEWISRFWSAIPPQPRRAVAALPENGCHVENLPFPRSWCEGLAARQRGDEEAAQTAFTATRFAAEQLVREQPQHAGSLCVLGMANAALGRKAEAIAAGERAVELVPVDKDALTGPLLLGYLAIIYAWTDEPDRALEQLERATSIPSYWSYGNLKLHPYWDKLRGNPRFEKIVTSLAPK